MAVEIPSYATSPFFITAGMLMPPWTDPNAVMKFSNYLVGMGLKMGAAPKPSAKSMKALKDKGVKINPHMSTFKGIKNAKGKYIIRVDSDDYINNQLLTVLASFLD